MVHNLVPKLLIQSVIVALVILVMYPPAAGADEGTVTATLNWEHPTTREDGSALNKADIAAYEIAVGGSLDDVIVVDGTETSYVHTYRAPYGDLQTTYAIRAVDTYGLKSRWSDEVVYQTTVKPGSPPSAPALSLGQTSSDGWDQ